MSLISERDRQDLLAFLDQADSDGETTGLFVYVLAPRRGGLVREGVLTTGNLPLDLAERIETMCRKKLEEHNRFQNQETLVSPH